MSLKLFFKDYHMKFCGADNDKMFANDVQNVSDGR